MSVYVFVQMWVCLFLIAFFGCRFAFVLKWIFRHLISDGHHDPDSTHPLELHTQKTHTSRALTWTWHISAGIFLQLLQFHSRCAHVITTSETAVCWVYMQVCVQVSLLTCSGWKQENEFLVLLLRQFSIVERAFRDYLYVFCCVVCVFPRSQHMWTCSSGDSSRTARLCILINDDYLHPISV